MIQDASGIELFENNVLEVYEDYPECLLVITGDLNSRTGDGSQQDFLIDDSTKYFDTLNAADYSVDTFSLPRKSKDCEVNTFGLRLLTICALLNVHIVNGRYSNDSPGEFTWITYNGASVVDYLIVSSDFYKLIQNFCVTNRTESDHLPLEFEIACNIIVALDTSYDTMQYDKLVWNSDKADVYKDNVKSNLHYDEIDKLVQMFCSFIWQTAHDMVYKPIKI
ncbi:hypothetical protein SNE40_009834 [Patella caerulea]|uniref:Endonuclease/exonuclease/phosphatase domain-containing protein n=1 Tax=Patella caerulea TaxID=87958 RepID=A0AAN8Q3R8_PATCE